MTVQELIDKLLDIEDKTLQIVTDQDQIIKHIYIDKDDEFGHVVVLDIYDRE